MAIELAVCGAKEGALYEGGAVTIWRVKYNDELGKNSLILADNCSKSMLLGKNSLIIEQFPLFLSKSANNEGEFP